MARKAMVQTAIPGFGCVYQPVYKDRHGQKQTSAVYWMKFKTADKPVRRSTGQTDVAGAFAELMKVGGQRASGHIIDSAPERVLIGQLLTLLVESYEEKNTLYDLKRRVERTLRPRWAEVKAVELRTGHLDEWVRAEEEALAGDDQSLSCKLASAVRARARERSRAACPKVPVQE